MQSKTTRIAYLRRMLKRLESEEGRLQQLVAEGELTAEGAELGKEQLLKNRAELLTELRTLEGDAVTR